MLAIAPLPPPITGHSLLSQLLADALREAHETEVVNLSIGSLHDGRVTTRGSRKSQGAGRGMAESGVGGRRLLHDFRVACRQSQGLFIYLICIGRLRGSSCTCTADRSAASCSIAIRCCGM
jgi:hypothetical protein